MHEKQNGFIHAWGSKKKYLTKKGLYKAIFYFHSLVYYNYGVFFCSYN